MPRALRLLDVWLIVALMTLVSRNATPAYGHERRAVKSVRLLGVAQPLKFQQSDAALVVDLPATLPTRHASALKISFRND